MPCGLFWTAPTATSRDALTPNFGEPPAPEPPKARAWSSRDGTFARKLSGGERHEEEVRVLTSGSPERPERLREGFPRAPSEPSGGPGEGRQAMVSEVAQGAGLDPEGDPQDGALGERPAAELVATGHASAEAGSPGFLAVTPEGEERASGGGAG